jgi:flagellar basal-body rod modification protein FlgD
MAATSTGSVSSNNSGSTSSSSASGDRMQSLSVQDFTNMLVAELKNQDPMEPMKNSDLLQQVSQIRAIDANDQLTTTLQAVLMGQSIASAGNLIGRTVSGLDSSGNKVSGTVGSVSISGGSAVLNVGSSTIDIKNVTQISPTSSGTTTSGS